MSVPLTRHAVRGGAWKGTRMHALHRTIAAEEALIELLITTHQAHLASIEDNGERDKPRRSSGTRRRSSTCAPNWPCAGSFPRSWTPRSGVTAPRPLRKIGRAHV